MENRIPDGIITQNITIEIQYYVVKGTSYEDLQQAVYSNFLSHSSYYV
jgi:hypothetical protein